MLSLHLLLAAGIHSIDTMNELNKAWFDLDLLANKEKDLLETLLHTCKAIKANCKAFDAQKAKINELVSKRPPAINRLPTELLSRIFTLCIRDRKFPEEPLHRIVGVSRRWRDTVLNDASFWTSIKVTRTQKVSLLKAQLKRSGSAPLDIWVDYLEPYSLESLSKFHELLDILVPHAERWHALIIRGSSNTELVIQKINILCLPSLRRLSIRAYSASVPALSPTRVRSVP